MSLIFIALAVAALLATIGGVIWIMSIDGDDRRTGSRVLFLALVWPVLVVPAIRVLWADTGWGKGER